MKTKRRYRQIVHRGGRRYILCGLAAPRAARAHTEPAAGFWLPGATFLLVLIFSAYVIGRPVVYPLGAAGTLPLGNVAHFTIDDFANASR